MNLSVFSILSGSLLIIALVAQATVIAGFSTSFKCNFGDEDEVALCRRCAVQRSSLDARTTDPCCSLPSVYSRCHKKTLKKRSADDDDDAIENSDAFNEDINTDDDNPDWNTEEAFEKRRSPFLGKRRNPFLGKRRSPFLGKRRSPFLGKRSDDDEVQYELIDKRRSPFLGK